MSKLPRRRSKSRASRTWRPTQIVPLVAVVGCVALFGSGRRFLPPIVYQPPSPEIEQLAMATAMTPEAQQLFYQQEPEIVPKHNFQTQCNKSNHAPEKTIILGCYSSNGYRGKITIQSVLDDRLEGTMEVTAAHEMLHAAYHKLSATERAWLAPRLKAARQWVTEPRLLALIEQYEDGDPEVYLNELHSYLGVELADLRDPELEKHYQKYFVDRARVVALAQKSQSKLNEIEERAGQLKPEIEDLEASLKAEANRIRELSDDLKSRAQILEQMEADLTNLRRQAEASLWQGDGSLAFEFEQATISYNNEVNDYNLQVQTHRDRIDRFNEQVEIYQQKIDDYNELVQTGRSILSTLEVDRSVETLPAVSP